MNTIENDEINQGIKYFEYYNEKITPLIEEIILAPSFNQRRGFQKKIVSMIREEGYPEEARRMRLVFNF